MAATDEMVAIALRHRPHAACIVPERREERTTEGGLDVAGQHSPGADRRARCGDGRHPRLAVHRGRPAQIEAAVALGAPVVELHTGAYCEAFDPRPGRPSSVRVRAHREGGGLCAPARPRSPCRPWPRPTTTVKPIAAMPEIVELNIGHFLIGEAIFVGLRGDRRRDAPR